MRSFALIAVAVVAGCGGSGQRAITSVPEGDPLALPEAPLAAETLPGTLASAWPIDVARGSDGWLVPWSDGSGTHARFIGDDGARDDRFLDGATTVVGAVALDDGYAVVVAGLDETRVHFLGGDGSDTVVHGPLDGKAMPGVASDGRRVVFATIVGGDIAVEQPTPIDATLVVAERSGARALALGRVAATPSVWGDRDGFIIGGTLLFDGDDLAAPAPGQQVRDARVFRRPFAAGTQPTSDTISLGSESWVTVDGLVGWAGRDSDGARLEVVTPQGRALVQVGDDLTSRSRVPLPSTTRGDAGQSWVAAVAGDHVVWGATVENDPVFAILDATDMHPARVFRIRDASSRTTLVVPGAASVLFAWTESRNVVRYSVNPW